MPGVKRSHTPTITRISAEEASELEKEIVANHVNLKRARASWYFSTRKI